MTPHNEQAKAASLLGLSEDVAGAPQFMHYSQEAFRQQGYQEGHAAGYAEAAKEAAERDDWKTHSARETGLKLAIQYLHGGKEPDKIVACAKVFYDFLRGAE